MLHHLTTIEQLDIRHLEFDANNFAKALADAKANKGTYQLGISDQASDGVQLYLYSPEDPDAREIFLHFYVPMDVWPTFVAAVNAVELMRKSVGQ